tara:strand:- start:9486 stop:10274 length:789 start_codon:yes stop_codon:yes gene_type:complete
MLRDIMIGVTRGCGDLRNGILLVHDERLVEQPSVEEVAKLADESVQQEILGRFVERGDLLSGIIFDEIWNDEVLGGFAKHFDRPVVIYRETQLDSFGNVAADFETGALLALTHLQSRGYDRIALASPLQDYLPNRRFLECCSIQASRQGYPLLSDGIYEFRSSDKGFRSLQRDLKKAEGRVAIICPEDNGALWLKQNLEGKYALGDELGILSAMGTSVARENRISSITYDFVEIGERAVRMIIQSELRHETVAPQLYFGKTT